MSLNGEINKVSREIRKAVRNIASSNMTAFDGSVRGTRKIVGYVSAVHTEGELAGTIDVKEFLFTEDENTPEEAGLHEGVLLSAIQNVDEDVLIVPMLYSEVMIVQNPADGMEYVIMYSYAQRVKMTTRSLKGENDGKVELGVTEVEDFNETDDGLDKDCDELEPTGNKTNMTFTASEIAMEVKSERSEYKEVIEATGKMIKIGSTTLIVDDDGVTIETTGEIRIARGTIVMKGIPGPPDPLGGPFCALPTIATLGQPYSTTKFTAL